MRKQNTDDSPEVYSSEVEMQRLVSLPEAARLQGTSTDTIRRRQADKIIRISPKRVGMRIRDALLVA